MGGTCYCIDAYLESDLESASNINAVTCTRLENLKEGTRGLLHHASISLYTQDNKQLGILNVASTNWQEISEDELRLLHTVGDLMSIAIERARLFRRSAEMGATNERNRLAREFHDTIVQGLAAIALKLETADVLLESSSEQEKVRDLLNTALKLTRDNLEEARRSVLDLRAAPLEGKSLSEAIQALGNNLPINVCVEVIGSSPPLPIRISTGLYRIAQEAITNVNKHARAKQVDVQLILTPDRVRLVIEDDGKGFDISQAQKEGHFGLIGLKERTRLLHGKLDIASLVGSGTVVEVTVPLEVHHD